MSSTKRRKKSKNEVNVQHPSLVNIKMDDGWLVVRLTGGCCLVADCILDGPSVR